MLLYNQDSNSISIKNPYIPDEKETKKRTKIYKKMWEELEDKNKKDIISDEVTLKDVCEIYRIEDAYKCNDCFKFVLEEQKSWHDISYKLESVKLGIRYGCSKCKKSYVGKSKTYCPKCKGKLKSELIEVVEIEDNGQKYFMEKKTDKRICSFEQYSEEKNEEIK